MKCTCGIQSGDKYQLTNGLCGHLCIILLDVQETDKARVDL